MIALKALIGEPPEIFGSGEPLARSIRIPQWRKLLSGAGLELRVVPSALWLILGEDIPGLAAVTPASAAAAKSAYAVTDLGNLGEGVSLGFRINASSEIVGCSYLDKVFVFNDNGQIVASGSNAQGQEHAFLLTKLASAPRIYRPPA